MSFDTIRYIINSGPHCLGAAPPPSVCSKEPARVERCRGSFTVLPALVTVSSDNVALWLGRASEPTRLSNNSTPTSYQLT